MGVYRIEIERNVEDEIAAIGPFYGRQVLASIESQLKHEPAVETKSRKMLPGLIPPFDAVPPIWELRVGEYRVFYDINEENHIVYVRAVRHKPPHKTTEEIL